MNPVFVSGVSVVGGEGYPSGLSKVWGLKLNVFGVSWIILSREVPDNVVIFSFKSLSEVFDPEKL